MKSTEIKLQQPTQSERFTNMVIKEFTANAGGLELTRFQKKLCQNYFIKIDQTLKAAETKRLAKSEKFRDALPFTWESVNMQRLAVDVVSYSSVGLDPAQPNHINIIPYKNTTAGKYDITFIIGYRGSEIKALKYGLDVPNDVVVELIYQNDLFKQYKKDINNRVESYEFEIKENFNRGEIVGGFYYHSYFDKPEKNKLRVFTLKDIIKRKPKHASAEFWGGEKDVWEDGKKVGKEATEGWYEEMCFKTVFRAAYNAITIDSEKIDEHFVSVMQRENENVEMRVQDEIQEKGNKGEPLGFDQEASNASNTIEVNEVKPETVLPTEATESKSNGPSF